MNVHRFYLFLYIFLFCFTFNVWSRSRFKEVHGPYRTVLSEVTRCDAADTPADVEDVFNIYRQVNSDGRVTLEGNITVHDFKDVKMSIMLAGGNGEKRFEAKSLNCHNTLVDIIFKAVGMSTNMRSCQIPRGTYTYHNVDLDKCLHSFIQSVTYGRFIFKLEVYKLSKSLRKDISCTIMAGEHVPINV